jgi:ATP-dependent RNA helicase DeaD
MSGFEELGVSEEFVKGLAGLKIFQPTKIQEKVIPILLNNTTNFIGQAHTGTGKTAAFGIPLLQTIDPDLEKIQGLILCPTRELGQQVAKQLFKFTKFSRKIFIESVYGGTSIDEQIQRLDRPTHIVVATPGRLIDLINRKAIDLANVSTVILDEADEMISMGFKDELEEILKGLKNVDQKWLFSATMPDDIKSIVHDYLSENVERVDVSSKNVVNKNIAHQYIACTENDKLNILFQFLKSQGDNRGVVFCRTKAATQKLAMQLKAKNIATEALHGDLSQRERDKVMRAFKNKTHRVLISTDVAARGIDIDGLTFVIHYQLPEKEEYYTHRAGRTARAGNEGVSLCLITTSEIKKIRFYERVLGITFTQLKPNR